MRSAALAVLALGFALAAPSAARAATVPVNARLTLLFSTVQPVSITGAGVATVNGSGGGAHVSSLALPGNLVTTVGNVTPVTDPAAAPIQGMQLTIGHAAGTLAEGFGPGGALGGVMPLVGVAKVCLFAPCGAPALANVSVPLSVIGAGGSQSVGFQVTVTVTGQPWTTGVAAVGTDSITGFAHGPASGTSSTAALSGRMRLVTAATMMTNFGTVAVPLFMTYDLHFVPEPGTALLVGSGVAALVAFGRARRR